MLLVKKRTSIPVISIFDINVVGDYIVRPIRICFAEKCANLMDVLRDIYIALWGKLERDVVE